jgi:aspartokinase/homoserine dehydrogenase 1
VDEKRDVTGISTISNISLLRVEGSGMVGVAGIAARLFTVLAQKEINAILISQASSEHAICVAISPDDVTIAAEFVKREFAFEIERHMMDLPVIEQDLCVLAVVGENMRHKPGIAGRLFSALGDASINVVAIAQGSSELNISIIIGKSDETAALNVIHEALWN